MNPVPPVITTLPVGNLPVIDGFIIKALSPRGINGVGCRLDTNEEGQEYDLISELILVSGLPEDLSYGLP